MSDALEIVLDFGMTPVPATSEGRDMREGVSDWVEGRLADIVEMVRQRMRMPRLGTNPGE
jgi:hypothetical protein